MSFVRRAPKSYFINGLRLALLAVIGSASPLFAADDLSTTAAALAPKDAAFFATSVNMQDQWQDLIHSRFVARLRAVPFIQQLESEFLEQWENPQGPLAQAKGAMENPNVINLLKLGEEMLGDEMFIYGGNDWCEMISGIMAFQNELTSKMSGGPEAIQAYMDSLEKSDIDQIRIPTTVIGFRIKDMENARLQLDALEGILRLGGSQFEQAQPFLQKLKRSDLSDGQTLSFSLDSSMIPLDQVDDDEREMAERALALIEGRSFSFALGVKSNILLLAFGEGESVIDSVGEGPDSLLDHKALAVLKDAAPENLRSIAYSSQRWRQEQWNANFNRYFTRMSNQLASAISAQGKDSPDLQDWQTMIKTDSAWMDEQMMKLAPEFGAFISWSFATEDGSEGYAYDWSENAALANAAPMTITEHAGTAPLMLVGFQQQNVPAAEEMLEYLLDKAPGHIKRFLAVVEEDQEEREQAIQVLDATWPVITDAYTILSDKIGPSLSDNQSLISVAGSWTTNQLAPQLPPAQTPLPLPEFGVACLLADRELFLSGCEEMYELFDRVVDIVREMNPESVPEGYTVPRPAEESADGATRYFYEEFSQAVPLPGFRPQLVVADHVIVFGYSDRQMTDMLESRPLETRPAWMTPETPTAIVSYVDMAGMFAAARPWIEYGLSMSGRPMDEPLAPAQGPIPTGHDVLQIWDCLNSAGKAASTVTVNENGPTVTRWVWVGE